MLSPHHCIALRAGSLEAHVYPGCGARVGRFFAHTNQGTEFDFFMPLASPSFDPHVWPKAGCFPMLPFVDKIAGNRLQWQDQTIRVSESDAPWFHGWGLRLPWQPVSVSDTACAMRLHVAASRHWPWEYAGEMAVKLDPDGLDIVLCVTNLSAVPMPASIGIHPYLRWPEDTSATVKGGQVWIADAKRPGCFQACDTEAANWWFLKGKDLPETPANLFFQTWDRAATIAYGGEHDGPASLAITSDNADFLTAFFPKTPAGYLCLEPATHLPGQFADGIAPHQRLQVQARFRPGMEP